MLDCLAMPLFNLASFLGCNMENIIGPTCKMTKYKIQPSDQHEPLCNAFSFRLLLMHFGEIQAHFMTLPHHKHTYTHKERQRKIAYAHPFTQHHISQ